MRPVRGAARMDQQPPCLDGYDAAVVYVYFRELQQSEPISWGAFSGAKVLYEQDAVHNYVRMVDRTLLRAWPPGLKRHRFDAVVSTGRDVAGWLSTDGFPAHWLPKGFDATSFHFNRAVDAGVFALMAHRTWPGRQCRASCASRTPLSPG